MPNAEQKQSPPFGIPCQKQNKNGAPLFGLHAKKEQKQCSLYGSHAKNGTKTAPLFGPHAKNNKNSGHTRGIDCVLDSAWVLFSSEAFTHAIRSN